jgi:thioredoxin-related protein
MNNFTLNNPLSNKGISFIKILKMKKSVFTLLGIFMVFSALAQSDTSLPYVKNPTIPAFNIIKLPDSTGFTNNDLQKKKPLILFFFNPDCEHCQDATKNMKAKIDRLKGAQIVMISMLDYKIVEKFYTTYEIAEYPTITMAWASTGFFLSFYKIHSIPAIYVYDKKGNFIKNFKGSMPVEEIADLL